jgi:2-oxoglutarate ferredoxin oxidoreductase subunit alpha
MFFTRGTSRDEWAVYTEKGEEYEKNMRRLERKWATAPQHLPKPVLTERATDASIGVIHFGTSKDATHEAIDRLSNDGHVINDLRILAFPFHSEVREFIEAHESVFVVEQNRDGQMRSLLINELEINPSKLIKAVHFNGDPISARVIVNLIEAKLADTQTHASTPQQTAS